MGASKQLSLDFLFGGVQVIPDDKKEVMPEKVPGSQQEPMTSPVNTKPVVERKEGLQPPPAKLVEEKKVELEKKKEEIPVLTNADKMQGAAYLEMICKENTLLVFLWGEDPEVCLARSHSSCELKENAWLGRKRALEILEEHGYWRSSRHMNGDRKAIVFRRKKT